MERGQKGEEKESGEKKKEEEVTLKMGPNSASNSLDWNFKRPKTLMMALHPRRF